MPACNPNVRFCRVNECHRIRFLACPSAEVPKFAPDPENSFNFGRRIRKEVSEVVDLISAVHPEHLRYLPALLTDNP